MLLHHATDWRSFLSEASLAAMPGKNAGDPVNEDQEWFQVQIDRADSEFAGMLGQSTTIYYVVESFIMGMSASARRIFEEFEQLHMDMNKVVGKLPSQVRMRAKHAILPLPEQKWFNIGSNSPDVVESRRQLLNPMLQRLAVQRELINDNEERFFEFLELPPALRAAVHLVTVPKGEQAVQLRKLWEAVVDCDTLTLLQHPVLQRTLLDVLAEPEVTNNFLEAEQMHLSDLVFACKLLERAFSRFEAGAEPPSEDILCSRIEVLLPAATSSKRGEGVRSAACAALLTLARIDGTSWRKGLCFFLERRGTAHWAELAEADTPAAASNAAGGDQLDPAFHGVSQRPVCELLLRGFGNAAVKAFLSPANVEGRKRLLNALFQSEDCHVRVVLGLILARLLCEPGYEEAGKAQAGLEILCGEILQAPDTLGQAGVRPLFLDDRLWTWLCAMLQADWLVVRTFALLVITYIVQPTVNRLVETVDLEAKLQASLAPENGAVAPYLAAKLLLSIYSDADYRQQLPADPQILVALFEALAQGSGSALTLQEQERETQASAVAFLRQRLDTVGDLQQLLCSSQTDVALFLDDCDAWRTSRAKMDEQVSRSEQSLRSCEAAIDSYRNVKLSALEVGSGRRISDLGDVQTPLLLAHSELEASQARAEALVEDMKRISKDVEDSRHAHDAVEEQVRKLQGRVQLAETRSAEEDHSAEHQDGTERLGPEECRLRYSDARARQEESLSNVKQQQRRLEEASKKLALEKENTARCQRDINALTNGARESRDQQTNAVSQWAEVLEAGTNSGEQLCRLGEKLSDTRAFQTSERTRRDAMQAALRTIIASLTSLDDHLESLKGLDASPEETA